MLIRVVKRNKTVTIGLKNILLLIFLHIVGKFKQIKNKRHSNNKILSNYYSNQKESQLFQISIIKRQSGIFGQLAYEFLMES